MKAVSDFRPGIEGLRLLELQVYSDSRGFFTESFREDRLSELGVDTRFVQDNHSRSMPGVLRGLHCQTGPFQGKLVRVAKGRIWDVVVDLRKGSPTFGRNFGLELNESNRLMLWIPRGFAHGFCVLGDEPADVVYKVDSYYSAETDTGVVWNDPDLAISWPLQSPILSVKDAKLPTLKQSVFSSNPRSC